MSSNSNAAARARRGAPRKQTSFVKRHRGAILAVAGAIVLGGLVAVAAFNSGGEPEPAAIESQPLSQELLTKLTSVPEAVFQAVGNGSAANPPKAISGTALTEDGKPEVLYVGAEFCPFCAAERWPLLVALSRFGTFSGVLASHSAADDVYPNTPTLSFYGSTYESPYLAFTPVELYTNERVNGSYARLQSLTAEQNSIVETYNDGGGIPYLYFAGQYELGGASFNPGILAGMTMEEIVAALANPSTNVSKAIAGSANILTAALCELTDGQPGSVCQAPEVVAASAQLK